MLPSESSEVFPFSWRRDAEMGIVVDRLIEAVRGFERDVIECELMDDELSL
jgi:hypothetical protein